MDRAALSRIAEAAELDDASTGSPSASERVASVVLVEISAAFTPIEIEGLVRTAAAVIRDCQVCRQVRTLSGSQ